MKLHPKVIVIALLVIATVAYVAYVCTSGNWQYYLLVDECVEQSGQFAGERLRVSGLVAAGSLTIANDRRQASFVLEGTQHHLAVNCSGLVPDNLVEGKEVVVEGALQDDHCLHGTKVITRCASKYAPQELARPSGAATPNS
jgi:cytochrome c-type biogenesis protein CcmE